MTERMDMGDLEVASAYITNLDVYRSLFSTTQVVIYPERGDSHPAIMIPDGLVERSQFYGVNKTHFPPKVLRDLLVRIFMDSDVDLPVFNDLEGNPRETPKHCYVKFAYYENLRDGVDLQLDLPPRTVLELTEEVRARMPLELIVGTPTPVSS